MEKNVDRLDWAGYLAVVRGMRALAVHTGIPVLIDPKDPLTFRLLTRKRAPAKKKP